MIFGLLVNPRTGEPFYASLYAEHRVSVHRLNDVTEGQGYFETRDDLATTITGYPRVHTPGGVQRKGQGIGTVLYTALCLAAHMKRRKLLDVQRDDGTPVPGEGDGICSRTGTRSELAEAWWSLATTRYGLANAVEGCAEKDFYETWEENENEHLAKIVRDKVGGTEVTIQRATVHASGTRKECGISVDVYPFDQAMAHGLVVGIVRPRGTVSTWSAVAPRDVRLLRPSIDTINAGIFHDRALYAAAQGARAVQSLLAIYAHHEGTVAWHDELSRAGRNLVARYTMGMDIDHANRMIVPVYRYYAEAATIQSAPPLRAPRLAAKARAPATEAALPSDRDVREALQATEQARVALGWRPFAQGDESP